MTREPKADATLKSADFADFLSYTLAQGDALGFDAPQSYFDEARVRLAGYYIVDTEYSDGYGDPDWSSFGSIYEGPFASFEQAVESERFGCSCENKDDCDCDARNYVVEECSANDLEPFAAYPFGLDRWFAAPEWYEPCAHVSTDNFSYSRDPRAIDRTRTVGQCLVCGATSRGHDSDSKVFYRLVGTFDDCCRPQDEDCCGYCGSRREYEEE